MFRITLHLTVIVCLVAAIAAAQTASEQILPAGTLVQCTLDEPNFSSRTAVVGDPVLCHIGSMGLFGESAFPRGAYLAGRLQDYRDPGHFVGKGWMNLTFDRLILPGAVSLPLSAKIVNMPHLRVDREGEIRGRGHAKRDAAGWAIPVLWPIKVLTLPERGPRPTLKGEVRVTLRLLEDVDVPPSMIAARSTVSGLQVRPSHASSLDLKSPVWVPAYRTGSVANDSYPGTAEAVPRTVNVEFSQDPSQPAATILLLNDNTGYLAAEYWLEGTQLHIVTPGGQKQVVVPVGKLNLDETVRLNKQRDVDVVFRSRD